MQGKILKSFPATKSEMEIKNNSSKTQHTLNQFRKPKTKTKIDLTLDDEKDHGHMRDMERK